jgi:hypothetical protein
MWDVQDILAERTSVTGDDELLVVWKPSWVAVSNVKPGPELRRFRSLPKWLGATHHMVDSKRGRTRHQQREYHVAPKDVPNSIYGEPLGP